MEYTERLKAIDIEIVGQFTKAMDTHTLKCLICNHIWEATPISKLQAHKKHGKNGCPNCHNSRRKNVSHNEIDSCIKIVQDKGYELLEPYVGTTSRDLSVKTKVRRIECGHIWDAHIHQIAYLDVKCRICNNQRKRNVFQQKNKALHEKYLLTATEWQKYIKKARLLSERNYNAYKDIINPNDLPRGLAGVEGAYQLDHIVSVRTCYENNVPYELCADYTNLQIMSWQQNLEKKNKFISEFIPNKIRPFIQQYNHTSSCLTSIIKMLKDNNILYEEDSSVISPRKVHLYIPQFRVAIRVYDVSNETERYMVSNNVPRNTYIDATKKGIRMIQIFSDEWVNSSEIVINKIMHICGIPNINKRNVYARKCVIKNIDANTKKEFLNQFHIQGNDKSQIRIGAYHQQDYNKLLAVMTFTKPRTMMGREITDEYCWELSRFATDTSINLPGIASKMLNYFISTQPQGLVIFSYADARWSVGDLYDKLGFRNEKLNKPSYWYIVNGKRLHRWGFRKDVIRENFPEVYDDSLTEYQMMLKLEIDRVWDNGTIRFVYDNRKLDENGYPINP